MNLIRPCYYLACLGVIILPLLVCVIKGETDLNPELFAAFLGMGISILAMGLSDKKLKSLNVEVPTWILKSKNDKDGLSKVVFQIENHRMKEPIRGLIISFRFPQKIYSKVANPQNEIFDYYDFGNTVMVFSDSIKFLPKLGNDGKIKLEHYLDLNKWDGNCSIYLTLCADESESKTFYIGRDQISKLLKSNSEHPYPLEPPKES